LSVKDILTEVWSAVLLTPDFCNNQRRNCIDLRTLCLHSKHYARYSVPWKK